MSMIAVSRPGCGKVFEYDTTYSIGEYVYFALGQIIIKILPQIINYLDQKKEKKNITVWDCISLFYKL